MRRLIYITVLGCGGPTPSEPRDPIALRVTSTDATIAIDGGVVVAAKPVSLDAGAVDVPTISPELASAPAWIYRTFSTGMIRRGGEQPHQLATYTLRRHDGRALLTLETKTAGSGGDGLGSIGPWSREPTKTYVGTVEGSGTALKLVLRQGSETLEMPCIAGKLAVAAAGAVRRPLLPSTNRCTDRGRWVPAATKQVDALRCSPFSKDEQSLEPDRKERFVFAAEPGVEFLYVDDDCTMEGGGYRAIAKDGAIAKPR